MTPKKPDWFEMTQSGDSYAGIKRVNKKLPIATLVVAGAVILGGSLFANANNESPAIAETPTASQSAVASNSVASNSVASNSVASNSVASTSSSSPTHATTSSNNSAGGNSLPAPTVSNAPQRGEGGHEGREGGEHREGDRTEHEDD